jgi:nucleoside-triphosphate--adenylate kinase
VDTDLSVFLYWLGQETSPLVDYYKEKGVLETFQGTESDKIYPKVKQWLEARIC